MDFLRDSTGLSSLDSIGKRLRRSEAVREWRRRPKEFKEETFLNASWSAREVEIPGNERENSTAGILVRVLSGEF